LSIESYTLGKKTVPVGTLQRALAAHAAGRFDEAEFCCRLVLAADKKQFDALHLLGMIEFQRGRFNEAHLLIRQAVKINSRSVQARSNLGLVLQQLDRPEEALAALNKALSIEPDNLLALNNRGHVLWRLKRPEEALLSLDRALAIKPDYADALCNRGNALVDLRRLEDALASYDQALAINPHDAPTLTNRGNVLWALNHKEEALQSYEKALAVNPDDLPTLVDRGTVLLNLHRGEESLACFDRALRVKPDDPYLVFKRGSALIACDRYEEALDCFDQAFSIVPGGADVLDDRGNALAALQRHAEAIASFDQALAIAPESASVHWNRALALLRAGDFEQGWKEYEWRWKVDAPWSVPRDFPKESLWLGEQPVEGKTVLLYAEQGLGDTIQFVRYVSLVTALGAKVILEVQPELKTLLSDLKDVDGVIAKGEELPQFDFHCPLLSLPLAFGTRLETIPAATPYLQASSEAAKEWDTRLATKGLGAKGRPRIGLVWSGRQTHSNDHNRSIALRALLPLLDAEAEFVSLQKDIRPEDAIVLKERSDVPNFGDSLESFSDAAALVSNLDLVISVDTSIAHLAGALAKPVFVLLPFVPDSRWLLDRDDSPWYPTARLFRQPKVGDWQSVVRRVADEIAAFKPT